MPLFSSNKSTDPQTREFEKRIASDARVDQKNLDHAISDLKKAEKTHMNAIKTADKAQHSLDTAVSNEHKAATALNKNQHQYDTAVADEQNAEKTLDLKRQHQARLEKDLQQRRATMEEFQHRKDINDQSRETKLSEIHAEAASRAGSRASSINRGPYPIGRGATGAAESMPAQQQNAQINGAAGMTSPSAGPATGVPSA